MTRLAVVLLASLAGTACTTWGPRSLQDWGDVEATPAEWVDTRLAPELARELREHPRFQGETLAVGLPNELRGPQTEFEQRLDRLLESRLLHASGLRLQPAGDTRCGDEAAAYRLGFVVSPLGREHRVELRMLDARSGEWVTGVADSWQGALPPPDQHDHARLAVSPARDGSEASPFAAGDADLVARALADELSCALVAARLRAGAVAPEPGNDRLASLVAGYLEALPHPRTASSRWRLAVARNPAGAGLQLVIATLASEDGAVTARRYVVTGSSATGQRVTTAGAEPIPPRTHVVPAVDRRAVVREPEPAPVAPRLDPVACGNGCAGVHYDGDAGATVLVAVPGRGLASTRDCAPAEGAGGVRLATVPTRGAASLSFYGLAAAGEARDALAQFEAQLPSACRSDGFADSGDTFARLGELTAEAGSELAWTELRVEAGTLRRKWP
jgi:hypothetical protein